MHAVQIDDLSLVYPGGFQALDQISLVVSSGDFFALLGPNGAGKTTLIDILTHLLIKTAGRISVFGYDLEDNLNVIKRKIGVVPQEFNFNVFEKVGNILVKQAGFYGVAKSVAKKKADRLLRRLNLWDKRHEKSSRLSGGMKRRLMIARALVHDPKLLILDEPTAGVDIELRKSTWEFLQELNAQGTTIILTTHYLEEAEILCNRLAIMNLGKIVNVFDIDEFLSQMEKEVFIVSLKGQVSKQVTSDIFPIRFIDKTTLEVEIRRPYTLNAFFSWLSTHELESISIKNKSNRLENLLLEQLSR